MGIHTESKQHWRTRPRSGHTRMALRSGDPGSRMESTASPNDMQFVWMLMFLLFLFFAVWGVFILHYSAQIWIPKRMTPSGICQAICLPHDNKSRMCILGEWDRSFKTSSGCCWQWKGYRMLSCRNHHHHPEVPFMVVRQSSWWGLSRFKHL